MSQPCSHPFLAAAMLLATLALADVASANPPETRRAVLPVTFELNRGQTDASVQFLVRGRDAAVFLKPTEAVIAMRNRTNVTALSLDPAGGRNVATSEGTAVRMTLVGGNPAAQVDASDPLPGRTNYVAGTDASRWLDDVPSFARVKYAKVYRGIDLVYHAREGQLEYDFVVAPGADPRAIQLGFEGASNVEIDADGSLVLRTAAGEIRKRRPLAYQEDASRRRGVDVRYVLSDDGRVSFDVGPYDATSELVIDPVIAYSTFWGGTGDDFGRRIAVDMQGNVYIVGNTASANFPVTAGATQRTPGGGVDVFVTKFSPSGAIIYSTYFGGSCDDYAGGIAVDGAGNAYVTGRNELCSFAEPWGAFVVKLGPNGAAVYYAVLAATYTDGSWGQAIAVDTAGNAYVTGTTSSSSRDFPTTPGAYRRTDCGSADGGDGFVAKLNAAGTALVYSTFLCGTANDSPNAIKVDQAGYAYIAGSTDSHDFPTLNALQPQHKGGPVDTTGFVTKLKPDGSGPVYSTYLGGSWGDVINDLALDSAGNVYVTGSTVSGDFPITAGVVQPGSGWPLCLVELCSDAFATKINAAGSALVYSTYIAAEGHDSGYAIAVDGGGNAYIAGATASLYLPILNALQSSNHGLDDGFVVKLNPNATRFVYASYLGGSAGTTDSLEGEDRIIGIALDSNGNAYVTGQTLSRDFPVTANAVQRTFSGTGACDIYGSPCGEAFMTKISAGGAGVVPPVNVTVTPTDVTTGGTFTASWSGIPTPTPEDELNLYVLGGMSDSGSLVASWRTTGAAAGTLLLRLPATMAPGWYELRVLSPDPEMFGLLGVVARSAPINVAPHPDVVATAVTNPPAIVPRGGSFIVTDTTANRGNLVSAASMTRFYLSLDRVRGTEDRLLTGARNVGALAPNATSTGTTTVTVPTATPVGTYVLLACADDTATNIESNEGNNCIASATSVMVTAADLAATVVTNPPATARLGSSFVVTDTTSNRGSAYSVASVTRYYLSLDRARNTGDRLLSGGRNVPVLAPNAGSTGAATVTIPTTTPVGSYFLLACADDSTVNAESNEANNCIPSTTAMQVGP